MVRTRYQEIAPETPTPAPKARARAPKRIASKQKKAEGDAEELSIKVLKEWVDWDMPLFKIMEAATVKEEWLSMVRELVREIFWRYRYLSKEVLGQILRGGQPTTPGVIWATDYVSYAEKLMLEIQGNVCDTHETCARIFLRTPEGMEYRLKASRARKAKHKVGAPDHETLEKVLQLKPYELVALWAPIVSAAKLGYWDDHKSITNGRAVIAYMKWSSYSIISQFAGLMKSELNAEMDISAEARQLVLLSTQDSGQLNYWPDKDRDYPADSTAWIACPTHLASGMANKDFKNLMLRFKYTPGDPLEQVALEGTPKGRGRKGRRSVTASAVTKGTPVGSETTSETVCGDTSEMMVLEEERGTAGGLNKVVANTVVSHEVSTNDKEVSEETPSIGVEIFDEPGMPQGNPEDLGERCTIVGPVEVYKGAHEPHDINEKAGSGGQKALEMVERDVFGGEARGAVVEVNLEKKREMVKECNVEPHVKAAIKEVVMLEQVGVPKKIKVEEEEISELECSEEESGEDDESGSQEGDSDEEDDSEVEVSNSDSDSDGNDENQKELRRRLKRYGGLPAIPKKSIRLEAAANSRLVQKEWKDVERIDSKNKKELLALANSIRDLIAMKTDSEHYVSLGALARGAHNLTELKKVNKAYKQIIIAAVQGKKENETMMKDIEAERVKAVENDRLYELAMLGLRESSGALSKDREDMITSSLTVLAQASGSGEGKVAKTKKRKVDRGMLFGPIAKKLKE